MKFEKANAQAFIYHILIHWWTNEFRVWFNQGEKKGTALVMHLAYGKSQPLIHDLSRKPQETASLTVKTTLGSGRHPEASWGHSRLSLLLDCFAQTMSVKT